MRGDERQESPFCGAGGRAGCLEGDPLQGLCRGPNAINTRERGVKARLLLVWARSSSSGGGLGGYEITPELNQGSVCVGGRAAMGGCFWLSLCSSSLMALMREAEDWDGGSGGGPSGGAGGE